MSKILRSFCCCVIQPTEKTYTKSDLDDANIVVTNPSSIITQVSKGINLPPSTGIWQRLKNGKTTQNSKAVVSNVVTEGQAQTNGININITSPMPSNSFFFAANTSELADLKQREKFKEDPLLPTRHHTDHGKVCLIVDLDETLVHSSFKPVKNADFIIPVEIDNVVHQVYVLKRPYADEFLERVGALFECVLFTASLAKYADPVADLLDKNGTFRSRLFREACVFFEGYYVKDLDRLGRDLNKVVIIDNSPTSYAFHPKNALPVRTWFNDPHDCELLNLIPHLEVLANTKNIYSELCKIPFVLPTTINSFLPPLLNSTTTTISTTKNNLQEKNFPYNNQESNYNNNNNDDNSYNTATTTTTIISSLVPNSNEYNYGVITSASSAYTQQLYNNNNINNTTNNKKLFMNNSKSSYITNNQALVNDNKRFSSNKSDNIIKNYNNSKDVLALRASNSPKR